jgi:transposase
VNQAADADPKTLRISMDAKATVKVGPFSRNGKSRVAVKAADHDFEATARVTPVGIFLPATDELFLSGVTSKVTSDCLVDRLEQWWESVRERFASITTLVVNLDNGPETHSRRTQFLFRMVQFAHRSGLRVRLAYYPPYHSKYNAIERCWGILEMHWNGALLESVETVIRFAQTMTWKGVRPLVELVTTTYKTGVKQTKEAMAALETQVERLPELEKWFVDIVPPKLAG